MIKREQPGRLLLPLLAAIGIGLLLSATSFAVSKSQKQKNEYIAASQKLVVKDLADASAKLEKAVKEGDIPAINRAAGQAEAYLSRSGLKDCGTVYSIINGICEGEYDSVMAEKLSLAVKKALDGDGGEALRSLCDPETSTEDSTDETTEELISAQILKKIGKGGKEFAEKRAASFACPNAVFKECQTDRTGAHIFSGDNIFVAVEGTGSRVTMYCFDRDVNENYRIPESEAARTVDMIVTKEKLRLSSEVKPKEDGGIYRFVYPDTENESSALVVFEIYADTGRLRKYDASNYYKKN